VVFVKVIVAGPYVPGARLFALAFTVKVTGRRRHRYRPRRNRGGEPARNPGNRKVGRAGPLTARSSAMVGKPRAVEVGRSLGTVPRSDSSCPETGLAMIHISRRSACTTMDYICTPLSTMAPGRLSMVNFARTNITRS
jgi:hypothetical protein